MGIGSTNLMRNEVTRLEHRYAQLEQGLVELARQRDAADAAWRTREAELTASCGTVAAELAAAERERDAAYAATRRAIASERVHGERVASLLAQVADAEQRLAALQAETARHEAVRDELEDLDKACVERERDLEVLRQTIDAHAACAVQAGAEADAAAKPLADARRKLAVWEDDVRAREDAVRAAEAAVRVDRQAVEQAREAAREAATALAEREPRVAAGEADLAARTAAVDARESALRTREEVLAAGEARQQASREAVETQGATLLEVKAQLTAREDRLVIAEQHVTAIQATAEAEHQTNAEMAADLEQRLTACAAREQELRGVAEKIEAERKEVGAGV